MVEKINADASRPLITDAEWREWLLAEADLGGIGAKNALAVARWRIGTGISDSANLVSASELEQMGARPPQGIPGVRMSVLLADAGGKRAASRAMVEKWPASLCEGLPSAPEAASRVDPDDPASMDAFVCAIDAAGIDLDCLGDVGTWILSARFGLADPALADMPPVPEADDLRSLMLALDQEAARARRLISRIDRRMAKIVPGWVPAAPLPPEPASRRTLEHERRDHAAAPKLHRPERMRAAVEAAYAAQPSPQEARSRPQGRPVSLTRGKVGTATLKEQAARSLAAKASASASAPASQPSRANEP